jgi:hypothetical protein
MGLFDTTEHFFMPTSAGDRNWYQHLLKQIDGDSIEVAGHPGAHEEWRALERDDLCLFAVHAREVGHDLIGWQDL